MQKLLGRSKLGHCGVCNQNQKTIVDSDDLVEVVHGAIDLFYSQTSSVPSGFDCYLQKEDKWEQAGELINDILMTSVVDNEDLAEEIRECLEAVYGVVGEEALSMTDCPYSDESMYEDRMLNHLPLVGQWENLKRVLAERSRYFNQQATNFLDSVFAGIKTAQTSDGNRVIKEYLVADNDTPFFRARWVNGDKELEEAIRELPESIAATPSAKTANGRMNVQGISVFYGALDVETCIAEIRPPVSSTIIVGEFRILKDIRLLDFDALLKIVPEGESIFDDTYRTSILHTQFLKNIVREMGRPVIQGAKRHEYLATQFISEYLAQYEPVKLDGVLFSSSQGKDNSVNIVLFNKSSRTKDDSTMQTNQLSVSTGYFQGDEDDWNDDVVVSRTPDVIKGLGKRKKPDLTSFGFPNTDNDERPAVLQCVVENTRVFRLDEISYLTTMRSVHFHDSEEREELDF